MKRPIYRLFYFLLFLAASVILLYGCGNNGQPAGKQPAGNRTAGAAGQEKASYVALPLTLPEYSTFDGAWSDGADLYYAASQHDEAADAVTTSFHVLRQGAAEPEERFTLAENQLVLHMTMDDTGHTYYVGYQNVAAAEDGSQPPVSFFLYKVDADGAPLLTVALAEYIKDQEVLVQDIAVDGEGRIVLACPDQNILVLDPDGSLLFETRAAGMILDLCSSGGRVFLGYDDLGQTVIREIDMSAQKLAGKWELSICGRLCMSGSPDGDLLLADEEGVYRYGTEKGELVQKFAWQSYDFYGINSGHLLPYGENGVLAVNRDWSYFPVKVEAVAFREAAAGEVPAQEKIILTISMTPRPPNGLYEAIAAFNLANPEYKIEAVSTTDYMEEYINTSAEIIAGQGPDIVMMPAHNIDQLSYRGALVDLYPYLHAEYTAGTINPEDLQENVIAAFEQDGQLYGLPVQYEVETIVIKSSLAGKREHWNLEEFTAFTGDFPDELDIFNNESKSSVLRLLKRGYYGRLVNLEEPEAPLDRELLVQMLEYANRYENDSSYLFDSNVAKKIYEDKLVLLEADIYSSVAYAACSSLLGEPVTLIGYPTDGQSGNLARSYDSLGISQNCQHKDIAWSFISSLLSKEFQADMIDPEMYTKIPIRKDALERDYQHDLDELGYRDHSGFSYYIFSNPGFSYGDWEWYFTEEDQQPLLDVLDHIDGAWRPELAIDAIIEEEAAYYFNGDKPLEEVVDVIEDRIKTYVYEKQ